MASTATCSASTEEIKPLHQAGGPGNCQPKGSHSSRGLCLLPSPQHSRPACPRPHPHSTSSHHELPSLSPSHLCSKNLCVPPLLRNTRLRSPSHLPLMDTGLWPAGLACPPPPSRAWPSCSHQLSPAVAPDASVSGHQENPVRARLPSFPTGLLLLSSPSLSRPLCGTSSLSLVSRRRYTQGSVHGPRPPAATPVPCMHHPTGTEHHSHASLAQTFTPPPSPVLICQLLTRHPSRDARKAPSNPMHTVQSSETAPSRNWHLRFL